MDTWTIVVNIAQTFAAVAAAASALFAGLTVRNYLKDRANAHLLSHAKTSLQRAFEALCGTTQAGAPPHDRLAWLTSARLIEEYKATKERISDKLTLQECESHEEHWRHQFYMRLESLQAGPASYFTPRPQGSEIQKTSAIIIHHFATWPEGRIDPLSKYQSSDDTYDKLGIHMKWFHLRIFCNRP